MSTLFENIFTFLFSFFSVRDILLLKEVFPLSFGSNLRFLREQRNISQKMLSIKIGVAQSSISDWEADRKMPPSKTILKLADILDVSTDEIFERPIPKTPPCSSPISQLCAAYNLNDTARAMIETIISMPPAEREVVAGLARRFSSALDRDDDELLNRSAEQLDREKEAESKTKARA